MLRIKDLKVAYGATQALWGVDLEVKKGEITALVGANGAGKSSLLNCCMGIVNAVGGQVVFKGTNVLGLKTERIVRSGMTLVPEGRHVFPSLTVDENLLVATYGCPKGRASQDAKDLVFTLFPRLGERRRQKAGTMSGGEQQMLALGRALMASPQVLLLDEPSLGLAPVMQEQLFEKIQKINSEGMTILLVEQNAFLALEVSNRAYVIQNGKTAFSGTSAELIKSPDMAKLYLGA